jgi:hypothetical protein
VCQCQTAVGFICVMEQEPCRIGRWREKENRYESSLGKVGVISWCRTMFESCHHSGDSSGSCAGPRCADVAEKLAQLFGWRQTYKVEKLQRSLVASVARRNLMQQQSHQAQTGSTADAARKVSDSSCSGTGDCENSFRDAGPLGEISGSHGGTYEDGCHLGCCIM